MKNYTRLIRNFLFLFFLVCSEAKGQFPGYYVQHFNSENGLPNTIKGLIADSNGYVWIATESGMIRYDGQKFKFYDRTDEGKTINRLYEIGLTKTGKVFTKAADENYYFISPSNTLKQIQPDSLFNPGEKYSSQVSTAMNLFYQCQKKLEAELIPKWAVPNFNPTRSHANSFAKTDECYYFLNASNQIVVTDTALRSFHLVSLKGITSLSRNSLTSSSISVSLFQNDQGIFFRYGDTIYKMDFAGDRKTANLRPLLFVGKISSIAGLLFLPKFDITIVSTIADGIYIFQKQYFSTVLSNNSDNNVFYAQAPFGNEGSVTSKGLLFPGYFKPFKISYQPFSAFRSSNGNYYLNKRNESICIFDSVLRLKKEIPLKTNAIGGYMEMEDGSILFCTNGAPLLGKLRGDSIVWVSIPKDLPENFAISTFIQVSANNVWIGGMQGLAKIDISNATVHLIPELTGINVRALYKDRFGTLWIGTYGSGFYAWHKNRLIKIPYDTEHYLAYAHAFLPDNSGRLWISTNHGLFAFNITDLYRFLEKGKQTPPYIYFDHTAGFQTNEFNGGCLPSGIVLGNGKFSLPSVNGLVQFYADSVETMISKSDIFIDDIIADTTSITLTNDIINIPAAVERLRIYVSSPYFGNPYNQNIEFSLDKSHQNWYPLDKDNIIELNNLKKGEHQISLRKAGPLGEGRFITKELTLLVKPGFYETGVFKLFMIAAIGLFLFFLYKLRISFLVEQKKLLESEVREKTSEQFALIDSLETTVSELEQSRDELHKIMLFKETLAMIITHDLQSPLQFLSEAIDRLHKKIYHTTLETQELSDELRTASVNIYRFVEEFGFWVKKANMNEQKEEGPVNVYKLFSELEIFFREQLKTRENNLRLKIDHNINVFTDYQLLKIILRNIIDNANKHTYGGLIRIELIMQEDIATLKIADTGKGIKREMLERLNTYTKRESSFRYTNDADGIGFGYRFVTDFCRMLNILVAIESMHMKGTTVILSNLKAWRLQPIAIESPPNPKMYDDKSINRR